MKRKPLKQRLYDSHDYNSISIYNSHCASYYSEYLIVTHF